MADPNKLEMPSLQKLQSSEQMELLDVVDSLRSYGLSKIVALPQLIVCGDQSSGKSSVLEAISGIPFPRQDTLCTRFATEVILRRTGNSKINISIVPGEDRNLVDRERLLGFHSELKTKDDFGDLFSKAKDAMGLSSPGNAFSNDILRIEFCGPSQPQLTLVDLPGLIHSETKFQTTTDVQLVHNLVSQYLENPRSIILAVVSAKNDISNQIILRNARKVDPQGLRTLGIITKPDMLVRGSKSEEAFIALARNEDVKFSLGWHVVKNLDSALSYSQQEDTRDRNESAFFEEGAFSSLPAHTIGIASLRARLSKVLFGQIQQELPRLVDDIQIQIIAAKHTLDRLGPSRSTPEQQREFLISLSQTFQAICRDASKGDYDHEFFKVDANPEKRLCANLMNMHFEFAANIRKNGSSWIVSDESVTDKRYRSRDEAIKDACTLLKNSRGRELPGLPNPLLVGELFRQYNRPWEDLARQHIKRVWETTNRFLELLLRYLTNEDVCNKVFRFWLQPIMEEKLNLAFSKLDELLDIHKEYPMTTNSHFLNQSRSPRRDISKKNLDSVLRNHLQAGREVNIEELTQIISTMTSGADLDVDMVAAEEAFDNMNAYYEVALNLFTDNVPTLAIQAPIIREVPKVFCPTAVYLMDVEVVKRIAGETEEKIAERDVISRRLSTLEKGALICKQYAKRPKSIFELSSDTSQLSGPSKPDTLTLGEENIAKHTLAKSLFSPHQSSKSVLNSRTTHNIFGHLSNPSQIKIGTGDPQHTIQNDNKPSPQSKGSELIRPLFSWEGNKTTRSKNTSTEDENRVFGSVTDFSIAKIPGPSSPAFSGLSSDANTPPYAGLFMTTQAKTSQKISLPTSAAGKSSKNSSSLGPASSAVDNSKPGSSLFSLQPTPTTEVEGSSGVHKSNSSAGNLGLFNGLASTQNKSSLR